MAGQTPTRAALVTVPAQTPGTLEHWCARALAELETPTGNPTPRGLELLRLEPSRGALVDVLRTVAAGDPTWREGAEYLRETHGQEFGPLAED